MKKYLGRFEKHSACPLNKQSRINTYTTISSDMQPYSQPSATILEQYVDGQHWPRLNYTGQLKQRTGLMHI